MSQMKLPDFLVEDALGEIFLLGHRVCLHHVMNAYSQVDSPEAIVERYPTLPLSLVHKVIAFALDNHTEVVKYLQAVKKEISEQTKNTSQGVPS
jgi:uncharacterized protein (DUF433 family)